MANTNEFPEWLREALAGRPNVFLVQNSGKKENGRPVIDDSRVSRWLKGDQRPSTELAVLTARVLGKPPSEALVAAGHNYGMSLKTLERIDSEFVGEPTPAESVGGDRNDPGIGTIKARKPANMSDEDFKRLLNEYQEEIEWKLDRAARER